LTYVKAAEQAGFNGCHTSDHFHPWSERQGQSGYAFSWLGAAMQATRFPFSIITAPGQRYHPTIVAQAIGTLLQMFPNRLTVSLGSGEALNECITGQPWPEKNVRNMRLHECADVIRRLMAGEEVSHEGLVTVRNARLYTRPSSPPPLMCAALTRETSAWAGSWASGLLTTYQPDGKLAENIAAFRTSGGVAKPIHVKLTFSYARDDHAARNEAHHQWRFDCIENAKLGSLDSVAAFDAASEHISIDEVVSSMPVFSDPIIIVALIQEIALLGVDHIVLHNVGRNQLEFISDFGRQVIPHFKGR
jgi:probable non-F420 flavinoid oxidoreductase